jgi:hypothetical protein
MLQSIAKTKKGNFKVRFEIVEAPVVDFQINAFLEMNGKDFFIEKINENFSDRIGITPEIANEFGVKFSHNIKLQCDISKVVKAQKEAIQAKKSKKYDGSMIDSGYGFMMKNTEKNHLLCAKFGYDAIEKIK